MYLTGVPKPVRPKAEKHRQPRDERQRDYCGSKATEQPRVIHPSKSRLQRGCQISHKTYSGRVSGRVTGGISPTRVGALSPPSVLQQTLSLRQDRSQTSIRRGAAITGQRSAPLERRGSLIAFPNDTVRVCRDERSARFASIRSHT
jgi:hypothetical protein